MELNYFREEFKNPRWGWGKPVHGRLSEIIGRGRDGYRATLERLLAYSESYLRIRRDPDETAPYEPHINNRWLPGLDSFSLYALLALRNPARYVEVGSGNSTKFARRSIRDNGLRTKIHSIDPEPRADVNPICDEVLRKPVEDVRLEYFDMLEAGDMLFVDDSHRCFMNSDVTAVFMDILPRLKPGVVVEFHDIFLPSDYPPDWGERYYSEQYLLAAYLLAEGRRFEILLPNAYISGDDELMGMLAPLYRHPVWEGVGRGGGSFWLVMK